MEIPTSGELSSKNLPENGTCFIAASFWRKFLAPLNFRKKHCSHTTFSGANLNAALL